MASVIIFLACAIFLIENARGQMPDVYEFCSGVMEYKGANIGSSSCNQCQGRTGKRGPLGGRGPKGSNGDQGIEGSCDELRGRIERLEVLQFECTLGMKSRAVRDSQITTSSDYHDTYAGRFGRLDEKPSSRSVGGWSSRSRNVGQWIQVDLLSPKNVIGFITQGRPTYTPDQYVKSYKISCGNSVAGLTTVTEHGRDKVFIANNDKESKVYNWLPSPLTCRYVRLYPQTYFGHMSMRMEILGGECP